MVRISVTPTAFRRLRRSHSINRLSLYLCLLQFLLFIATIDMILDQIHRIIVSLPARLAPPQRMQEAYCAVPSS